ncbi:MAG: hypothetical protein JXR60_07305 [Bacteroidales bacterium]|nr:hypothetical protein [Bacteroidales bacterium]
MKHVKFIVGLAIAGSLLMSCTKEDGTESLKLSEGKDILLDENFNLDGEIGVLYRTESNQLILKVDKKTIEERASDRWTGTFRAASFGKNQSCSGTPKNCYGAKLDTGESVIVVSN